MVQFRGRIEKPVLVSLCMLLRGNQKLSASTAPPGQLGGALRNTPHDPSLSCYSWAFWCCQLPVTNASHSARGVTNQLPQIRDGRFVILFLGCQRSDRPASGLATLVWQEWVGRDLRENRAWYNPKLATWESEEHHKKCRNLSHCKKHQQAPIWMKNFACKLVLPASLSSCLQVQHRTVFHWAWLKKSSQLCDSGGFRGKRWFYTSQNTDWSALDKAKFPVQVLILCFLCFQRNL